MRAKKPSEKCFAYNKKGEPGRCLVAYENNGFAGNAFLATLLSVIRPQRKTALFWRFSLSSTIPMKDKNIDAFPFSVHLVGH